MMKLEQLRVFAAVAAAGELSAAGSEVGRTPAAVSMTLRQIEEELGASLFEGGRKSRLTPLGDYVLERAQRVIREFDSAMLKIQHFTRGEEGVASLAAVPSAATRLVPPAISLLRTTRPLARVNLRDIDSAAVVNAVGSGAADFGVAGNAIDNHGLRSELLLADPFVLVCPSSHRLARAGVPVQWSDIDPSEFIANGLCAGIASPQLAALAEQARLMLHNTTSLLGFVEQGFGVTVLPVLAAPRSDAFSALPLADKAATRRLNVWTRPGETLSPMSQALLDAVRSVATRIELQLHAR